ncbi:MAG: sulfate ABC transporter substrate-binding protein [Actinobacteria bacterium]|nr:sulfate ABC transporter substrate-binding protein [Actinomycetota bacterium]MBV8396214.1 sulfate ABC transporter substrate-binding protein [Actinomycetota bacterium]MBV8598905.1 sulfate ABC transporter substrate-binding protein [Actinomycetota bacterium]
MTRLKLVLAVLVTALVAVAGAAADTTLNLVAYSTPKPVMAQIISDFQKTPDGQGVSFNQSYGPSTSQAKAIVAGLPADVAFLSTGDDVNYLADNGLVDPAWWATKDYGIAANTVVVFAVRHYNPKHIKGWADLIKPGVQVVTPNPFSSGSAKWNILAAYAAERHLGKTDAQAQAYVKTLFQHVVSQDSSGSNATNTFLSGKGDVLITYESEAIAAQAKGQDIEYVIPRQTMLIQLPIVPLKNSPNVDLAKKFIAFVQSTPEQILLGQNGFRPVDKTAAAQFKKKYPVRPGQFTIGDKVIGGWRAADKKWFDPTHGLMVQIEQAVGGPTSGA